MPRKVREQIGQIYSSDTLDAVIKMCPGDPANYLLELEQQPYGEGYDINIYRMRDETPEEEATRLKKEEAEGLYYKQQRQRAYEQLKKEFG
jgi:hypothetical protein